MWFRPTLIIGLLCLPIISEGQNAFDGDPANLAQTVYRSGAAPVDLLSGANFVWLHTSLSAGSIINWVDQTNSFRLTNVVTGTRQPVEVANWGLGFVSTSDSYLGFQPTITLNPATGSGYSVMMYGIVKTNSPGIYGNVGTKGGGLAGFYWHRVNTSGVKFDVSSDSADQDTVTLADNTTNCVLTTSAGKVYTNGVDSTFSVTGQSFTLSTIGSDPSIANSVTWTNRLYIIWTNKSTFTATEVSNTYFFCTNYFK